jgi:exosortase F-associated protein
MLQKLFKYKFRILLILILIFGLASIRAYENYLFYDPFLDYFKSNYQNTRLPEIDNFNLFLGLFFRYFLNSALSIIIIYLVFNDLVMIKFASIVYFIFFIILILAFYLMLIYFGNNNKMTLFYIRRFLIQPIFLLLFLPGFYFQKSQQLK